MTTSAARELNSIISKFCWLSVSRPLLVIVDWFFYLSSSNFLNFFFQGSNFVIWPQKFKFQKWSLWGHMTSHIKGNFMTIPNILKLFFYYVIWPLYDQNKNFNFKTLRPRYIVIYNDLIADFTAIRSEIFQRIILGVKFCNMTPKDQIWNMTRMGSYYIAYGRKFYHDSEYIKIIFLLCNMTPLWPKQEF